jgi:hypothetical protein
LMCFLTASGLLNPLWQCGHRARRPGSPRASAIASWCDHMWRCMSRECACVASHPSTSHLSGRLCSW